jgi:hypothetical protein
MLSHVPVFKHADATNNAGDPVSMLSAIELGDVFPRKVV